MRHHRATTGAKADGCRRLEVSTGLGRRRRWTTAEKAWIVAESLAPATTAAAVARRYGLHASQLFTWRQQLQRRAASPAASGEPAFVPVLLAEDDRAPAEAVGRMEIVLGPAVVRVAADVDAAALRRVLEAVWGLP
jgi:transposase